jgi:hypothetical protein
LIVVVMVIICSMLDLLLAHGYGSHQLTQSTHTQTPQQPDIERLTLAASSEASPPTSGAEAAAARLRAYAAGFRFLVEVRKARLSIGNQYDGCLPVCL